MTREEIIAIVGEHAAKNVAFKAFCWAMRNKTYSKEEIADAWYSFRDGWEACDAQEARLNGHS